VQPVNLFLKISNKINNEFYLFFGFQY